MIGIQSGTCSRACCCCALQQGLLLLCASASAAAFCSPAAGCGGMRVPRACAARVWPPALGSRLPGAARRERTGCVRASADGGDVEPPVLAGVQLAPGLGYEARKLTAWMPNLIKDRGVELMRVPRQNLLVEPITRQDGGEELLCPGPAGSVSSILTPTHVTLAQQLLQNKETLPGAEELFSRCDHAPLHRWSEAELAELQCAALAEQALAERAWLQRQHSSALGCSARPLETFLAAVDAVRTHALPCGGSLVVSPAACLLPRSVPRGATAALDDAGSGDLVIKSDGSGGLNVSAGWLTNDELLLSAGVAVLDLSTESVALPEEALWAAADEASALAPPVCDLSPSEWEGPVTLAAREKRQEVVRGLRRFSYVKVPIVPCLSLLAASLCSLGFAPPSSPSQRISVHACTLDQEEEPLAVLAGGLCSDALGNIMQVRFP